MESSKKQVESDATMVPMLEAGALQTFEQNADNVPNDEEKNLAAEALSSNGRMHVDDHGFLTTQEVQSVPNEAHKPLSRNAGWEDGKI